MTATKHTFRLLSDVVTVDRVTGGEVLPTDIVVGWTDVSPDTLPTLTVHQRWSAKQHRWMESTSYAVAEIPVGNGFDGRGFTLVKLATTEDGDEVPTDEHYGVFVARNGQDDLCDCKGHTYSRCCKHVDAMRHLIERGVVGSERHQPSDDERDQEAQRAVDQAEWHDAVRSAGEPVEEDPFLGIQLSPSTGKPLQPGELAFL